jgi:hypothetical protein
MASTLSWITRTPRDWSPYSLYNRQHGYMTPSLLGGAATGAPEPGISRTIRSQSKPTNNRPELTCKKKTFFATPHFWSYVKDGQQQGANETRHINIFTLSKMLIPVNIHQKHWVLTCIHFDRKRISWYDSDGDTHQQKSYIFFT